MDWIGLSILVAVFESAVHSAWYVCFTETIDREKAGPSD